MEVLQQVVGTLDQRLLIAIVVILIIAMVISVVKKLIKLALFVMALILVSVFVLPIAKDYQEKYNFRIEDGVAMITVEGKDVAVTPSTCKGIEFKGKVDGTSNYLVVLLIDKSEVKIIVPNFIQKGLQAFAESSSIPIQAAN